MEPGERARPRTRSPAFDYQDEALKLRDVVREFLDAKTSWLEQATPYVQEYRADTLAHSGEHSGLSRTPPENTWSEVSIGAHVRVARNLADAFPDSVYFDLECECEWEPEHGLQIVFRDGRLVRVGDYSGHWTNTEPLIYVPIG